MPIQNTQAARCEVGTAAKQHPARRHSLRSMWTIVLVTIATLEIAVAQGVIATSHVNADLPLRSVLPSDGFDYFSGYVASGHKLPAMYAHKGLGKERAVTVEKPGFHKEFAISQIDDAIVAYKALLAAQGYL